MSSLINRCTIKMSNCPSIISFASIVGKKKAKDQWHLALTKLTMTHISGRILLKKVKVNFKTNNQSCIAKGNLKPEDINFMFAGDLLNQCIGTTLVFVNLAFPSLEYMVLVQLWQKACACHQY